SHHPDPSAGREAPRDPSVPSRGAESEPQRPRGPFRPPPGTGEGGGGSICSFSMGPPTTPRQTPRGRHGVPRGSIAAVAAAAAMMVAVGLPGERAAAQVPSPDEIIARVSEASASISGIADAAFKLWIKKPVTERPN